MPHYVTDAGALAPRGRDHIRRRQRPGLSTQEYNGFIRRDGIAEQGCSEGTDIVRGFLGEFSANIAESRRHPPRADAVAFEPQQIVRGLRQQVGARSGILKQQPVHLQVHPQSSPPRDIGAGEKQDRGQMVEAKQKIRQDEGHSSCRGDSVQGVGRGNGGKQAYSQHFLFDRAGIGRHSADISAFGAVMAGSNKVAYIPYVCN